jgi:hypothetical protein
MTKCRCCGSVTLPTDPCYPECSDACAEWVIDAAREEATYMDDPRGMGGWQEAGGWF